MNNTLFTPFSYKSLRLQNRFVMAPMTRTKSPDGVPGEDVAEYYGRRASGDVGLILTEGTVIDQPFSKAEKDIPDFHGEAALNGWQQVVDVVHLKGGSIAPQLWHVGNNPNGPYLAENFKGAASMSLDEIYSTISAFVQAAEAAKRLGFDAIELHGAHGYLIDEFFWDRTNTRRDDFGGRTIKERSRFAIELIKAIRRSVGSDFAIILRLSQWKGTDFDARIANSPQELENWILPLADAGVDIFHASQRRYWTAEFDCSDLNLAGWFKKITGLPTITVGSIGLKSDVTGFFAQGESSGTAGITELLRRFERGDFDLVAVGRHLLQDPYWVKKIRENRMDDIKSFDANSATILY